MSTINTNAANNVNNQHEDTDFAAEILKEVDVFKDDIEKDSSTNPCPVDVLPEWARTYAHEVNRCLNVPIDYIVCSILSVSAAASKAPYSA